MPKKSTIVWKMKIKKKNKKFKEEAIAYFPWHNTGDIENVSSNAVTFVPSRCLATIGDFYWVVA
jgi:hypothetical protein